MDFDVKEKLQQKTSSQLFGDGRSVPVQWGMELKEEMQMDVVGFEMKLNR